MKTIISMASLLFMIGTIIFSGNGNSNSNRGNMDDWDSLNVIATAYNSLPSQTTKDNPALSAWGDTLKPGMKAIAVSRDLIKLGLIHNTKVRIKGFEGTFLVKDKMNARWEKKIDIYMGEDVKKAKEWGKRPVTIYYSPNSANY